MCFQSFFFLGEGFYQWTWIVICKFVLNGGSWQQGSWQQESQQREPYGERPNHLYDIELPAASRSPQIFLFLPQRGVGSGTAVHSREALARVRGSLIPSNYDY